MDRRPYFHLVFRPNIKLVSTVRRFTRDFYQRVLADQELASRLALATHEMLENAVTYANDDETAVRIDVDDDVLSIRTWNRAAPERITAIKAGIDQVMAAPDPEAYYQEQMLIAAKRTDGSGLGLARVRNEAEMSLSYEIDNDRVCICAVTKIVGGLNQ
jgi:anti-sigma regulatory factor (Ser/Thr protein kinase)